jgi:uncharacterized metal-binding protein YceD (DUF177 family)
MSENIDELSSSQSLQLLMNEIERLCNVNKEETQHFYIPHKVREQIIELFNEEVLVSEKYIYKFGDRYEEISDEIEMIPYGADTINIAQHIYDFIGISLPMKKLHPRFRNDDIDEDGLLVYTSEQEPTKEQKEQEIDPRWASLGKLRMNN